METAENDTTKRDKLFVILLVISSIAVIAANVAVNFF